MKTIYFNSRVDWWLYAIVVCSIAYCMTGVLLTSNDYWSGIVVSILAAGIEVLIFASVKYAIRGDKLGIRMFYRWQWFPIDKITEVKNVTGIQSAAALSRHRIAIKFSDRKILKSFFPLEISPKDCSSFISNLQIVNPTIKCN
ncbi:MAG: PH domain-containing protein [Muribaculaceae bacterium]|nr:PH domain-containing protein [Muribaculaceae bacterium]